MKHPKEMYYLAASEMCQRFAFWGIGNLLVLFLVNYYKFTAVDADQIYGIFSGVAFVLPLFGGIVADRMGYKIPVLFGCYSTSVGCFLISTGVKVLLPFGLALIAIGAGSYTPGIYATLGALYHHNPKFRQGGFSIYYSIVNFGVFTAMIVLGLIEQAHHWRIAFFIAAIVQLFGIFPYLKVANDPKVQKMIAADTHKIRAKKGKVPKLTANEKKSISVILILSLLSIFFWMAYNQGSASMMLFAEKYVDRTAFGFTIPSPWFLSIDNLCLILFALPLALLYRFLHKKKMDPPAAVKTAYGFIFIGICFLIMMRGASTLTAGTLESPWYITSAFAFMALGEMFLAPIGLSLITEISPKRHVAVLVGFWYVCSGLAFYIGGALAGLMETLSPAQFFEIFVFSSFITGIAILIVGKETELFKYKKQLKKRSLRK